MHTAVVVSVTKLFVKPCYYSSTRIKPKPQDDGYDFGLDRASIRDLMTSALPSARALTGDFWDTYVEHDQEMLYSLELFATLALQCHGLSRYEIYLYTSVGYGV